MPDNTAGVPVVALKKTQESYFNILKQYSSLDGEYLEIGPDIGLFTEYCVRKGKFEYFWLFEPNLVVRQSLEKIMSGQNYNIYPQMFDFSLVPNNRISTVAMIHVLDHILNPKSMLVDIRKKLTESAVLLFVTHDESSLLAKITKNKWPPYCLQHPQLFNPISIQALMESAGYKVLAITKSYNYFPIVYLLKHLFWTVGLRKIPLPKINSFTLPLKLGNIATIVTPMALS